MREARKVKQRCARQGLGIFANSTYADGILNRDLEEHGEADRSADRDLEVITKRYFSREYDPYDWVKKAGTEVSDVILFASASSMQTAILSKTSFLASNLLVLLQIRGVHPRATLLRSSSLACFERSGKSFPEANRPTREIDCQTHRPGYVRAVHRWETPSQPHLEGVREPTSANSIPKAQSCLLRMRRLDFTCGERSGVLPEDYARKRSYNSC